MQPAQEGGGGAGTKLRGDNSHEGPGPAAPATTSPPEWPLACAPGMQTLGTSTISGWDRPVSAS